MAGWTKLYSSIIHSTVWREDDHVRLVWITLLAMCDKNGDVESSIPGLADAARVSIDNCIDALDKLRLPDKFSRSVEFDGRRICDIDGGWCVLNYKKYRGQITADKIKEQTRERVAKYRAKQKQRNADCNAGNKKRYFNAQSDPDPDPDPEAEVLDLPKCESTYNNGSTLTDPCAFSGPKTSKKKQVGYPDDFEKFWNAYPKNRRTGKKLAFAEWKKATDKPPVDEIVAKLEQLKQSWAWKKDDGKYVKHPSRWIKSGGWDDEPGPSWRPDSELTPTERSVKRNYEHIANYRREREQKNAQLFGQRESITEHDRKNFIDID
jgi:hypothetical protein